MEASEDGSEICWDVWCRDSGTVQKIRQDNRDYGRKDVGTGANKRHKGEFLVRLKSNYLFKDYCELVTFLYGSYDRNVLLVFHLLLFSQEVKYPIVNYKVKCDTSSD